jgi:hypothetical protein
MVTRHYGENHENSHIKTQKNKKARKIKHLRFLGKSWPTPCNYISMYRSLFHKVIDLFGIIPHTIPLLTDMENINMSNEKAPNYTGEMETVLLAAVPFNYERAKELGAEIGRDARSVVAKIKRMENDETVKGDRPFYIAKEPYTPKTGKQVEKKSEIVSSLERVLGVEAGTFKGLDKAPKLSLEKVRTAILAVATVEAETVEAG